LDGLKYREIAVLFRISIREVERHVARAVFVLIGAVDGN